MTLSNTPTLFELQDLKQPLKTCLLLYSKYISFICVSRCAAKPRQGKGGDFFLSSNVWIEIAVSYSIKISSTFLSKQSLQSSCQTHMQMRNTLIQSSCRQTLLPAEQTGPDRTRYTLKKPLVFFLHTRQTLYSTNSYTVPFSFWSLQPYSYHTFSTIIRKISSLFLSPLYQMTLLISPLEINL